MSVAYLVSVAEMEPSGCALRMLAIGDKVPMGATLTLMVGDGNREVLEGDSLSADESMGNPDEAVSEGSAADESWF